MPTAVVEREASSGRKRHKSSLERDETSHKRNRRDEDGPSRRDRNKDKRSKESSRSDRKSATNGTSLAHSERERRGETSSQHPASSSTAVKSSISEVKPPAAMGSSSISQEMLEEKLKSKELIYEAKMKIQERLKELGLPVQHAPAKGTSTSERFKETVLKPEEASAFTQLHMQKVQQLQRLNEIRSRVAKGVSSLNLKTPSLVLETISAEKQISVKRETPGLVKPILAKIESAAEEKKPSTQQVEPDSSTSALQLEFLDPRLHLKPAIRQRRQFEFKLPGEYEKLAKMQRSKAKLERLQSEIEKAAKQTGISSAVKLAIVTPSGLPETTTGEYIPEVEWWDEVVLGNGKGYNDVPSQDMAPLERYADSVTDLVEHPIQLKPPDEPLQPQYLKASLTKKERKKLRRQNRREALKEKAEKIRLGLEKPPEPKLKISNLMRVLGTDAIQDPTKMEAQVRKQMAERAQKHVEDNKSRKLTREEKAAKAIRKIAEDTSLAVHVTVFRIKSLANPAKKFKVMMNAKQLQMTGVVILLDDINVIVMEGGPKQQKFYKNLLLTRIKWADEIAGQKHDRRNRKAVEDIGEGIGTGGAQQQASGTERNECTLIWEGVVQKRAFLGEPRFIPAINHKQARELLDKHGVAHYWDLCYSTTVLLNDDA